jgi:2-oxoglutarate ferredoxin oxidoreductase subunit alpha
MALAEGYDVAHAHIRYLQPFPKNLGEVLKNYEQILVPEMNNGQLVRMLRDQFLAPAEGFNKIKGMPFSSEELFQKIKLMSQL